MSLAGNDGTGFPAGSATKPAISFRGVGVTRAGRAVLADVSFEARAGSVVGILGPNGAGKSTLVKAAAGLLPFGGEIRIAGEDGARLDLVARARRVAYVPQHSALDAPLPAREVVAQGRFAHRAPPWQRTPDPRRAAADRDAVARALSETGTLALGDRPFSRLSYGERRLVLLARALATEARVLLFDEPTSALDVGHALATLAILRRAADAGACVIAVLHPLNEVVRACDRAVLLDGGRVVAEGATGDVVAAGPVRRAFGVDLVPRAAFDYRNATDTQPYGGGTGNPRDRRGEDA